MTQIYAFLGHEQWPPAAVLRWATLAERLGFDGVMVSDHTQPWVDDRGASGFAFSTLGAVAVSTERLRMATGVVTPLFRYHPAIVALAAASIAGLSGGRFELGVGTGERINEAPMGLPFPGYEERNERMTEALEIIRGLLDGEEVHFEGRHYRTDGFRLATPPPSPVPIWMAAQGPRSSALAGRAADGVITSVKDAAESLERVAGPAREAAAAAGRPAPRLVATRWSVHAASEEEAWEALLPWRGLRVPDRDRAGSPQRLREQADRMPRSEVLSAFPAAADAGGLARIYRPLVDDLGADTVVVQIASTDIEATLRMFASEVLPELRR
jgi:coenzyme F420-dependent glucose-6-phosphate dehydrogenase